MMATKKAAKQTGARKPKATTRKPIIAEHPGAGSDKPFVLLWAEKGAAAALRKGNFLFSEATQGAGASALESQETTGSGNEGYDTTF
ncbi:MAG: hypothetical protein ACRELB_18095 [Polyangiaceae bacterium]